MIEAEKAQGPIGAAEFNMTAVGVRQLRSRILRRLSHE